MDKKTITATGDKAREYILRGIKAIYEPVRMTLGPKGANALLPRTFNRGRSCSGVNFFRKPREVVRGSSVRIMTNK